MSEMVQCKSCKAMNEVENADVMDHFNCRDCGSKQNLSFVHKPGQFVNESKGADPIPMNDDKDNNGLPF